MNSKYHFILDLKFFYKKVTIYIPKLLINDYFYETKYRLTTESLKNELDSKLESSKYDFLRQILTQKESFFETSTHFGLFNNWSNLVTF